MMIEVKIETIQVSLVSPHRIIVFKSLTTDRYLPIWIGACETEAISMRLQGIEPPRPLTHDLIVNLMTTLGAHLKYVYINALIDETFYAQLVLDAAGREVVVDCRPSDSVAIAVRLGAAIYVDERVMAEAGLTPEPDLLSAADLQPDLDVFRDFLNRLNLDNIPTD